MASPRPRLVCSRTGIEPDNDDTDTAATISIDGLFHLSVDQVGSNMNAPFASTVAAACRRLVQHRARRGDHRACEQGVGLGALGRRTVRLRSLQDLAVVYGAEDPTTCLAEVFQKTRVMNRWHQDPWLVGFETLMADVLEWGHGQSVARERLRTLTERVPHPDWLFREAFPQLSDAQIKLAAFYARAYPRRGRPRREPFWRGREPATSSDTALDEAPGSCPNGIAASTAPGYH